MAEMKLFRVSWDWTPPRFALVGIAENTVPSHNLSHSSLCLENINGEWCVNRTDCGYFGSHWMMTNKLYNATLKKVNTVKEMLSIFLGKYSYGFLRHRK